jgi:RsiW-degrading membrane proteinase PrsW (M82 family)
MSRDLQGFLPDDSAIYGSVALHAWWNMWKEQIPVLPVVNIPAISAAWSKAHAGCSFF